MKVRVWLAWEKFNGVNWIELLVFWGENKRNQKFKFRVHVGSEQGSIGYQNLEKKSEGWSLFIADYDARLKRVNWRQNGWNRMDLLNVKSVTSHGSKHSKMKGQIFGYNNVGSEQGSIDYQKIEKMSEGWSLFRVDHDVRLEHVNWRQNQWNNENLLSGKSVTCLALKLSQILHFMMLNAFWMFLNMIRSKNACKLCV